MRNGNTLMTDVAFGAAAGLAATWLMGYFTSYLYEHENAAARRKEDAARDGGTAYGVAARKTAGALGLDLSDEQVETVGAGIHWALGAGAGAAYGALRHRIPAARAGYGLAFGAAFWAVVDEGANVALRLTPGPAAFPWQAHARGLTGHLVFGVVTESILNAASRATEEMWG